MGTHSLLNHTFVMQTVDRRYPVNNGSQFVQNRTQSAQVPSIANLPQRTQKTCQKDVKLPISARVVTRSVYQKMNGSSPISTAVGRFQERSPTDLSRTMLSPQTSGGQSETFPTVVTLHGIAGASKRQTVVQYNSSGKDSVSSIIAFDVSTEASGSSLAACDSECSDNDSNTPHSQMPPNTARGRLENYAGSISCRLGSTLWNTPTLRSDQCGTPNSTSYKCVPTSYGLPPNTARGHLENDNYHKGGGTVSCDTPSSTPYKRVPTSYGSRHLLEAERKRVEAELERQMSLTQRQATSREGSIRRVDSECSDNGGKVPSRPSSIPPNTAQGRLESDKYQCHRVSVPVNIPRAHGHFHRRVPTSYGYSGYTAERATTQQSGLKLAVFDFDCTLTTSHLFASLAGTVTPKSTLEVPPPLAKTEIGQISRLCELDADPAWGPGAFALKAFGGESRVSQLRCILQELRGRGVECIVESMGLVGPITKCLEQMNLLSFFSKVVANIGSAYGFTEYDSQLAPCASQVEERWLGKPDADISSSPSKPEHIKQLMREKGLECSQVVVIDDDHNHIKALQSVCKTIHVADAHGIKMRELQLLRNMLSEGSSGSAARQPSPLRSSSFQFRSSV